MHKTKETFSHVSALWSPGQTGVPRGAEGVAAGCDTCRDGHGDLGAGQGPGGPGPGAAQPGEALFCRTPPGRQSQTDLEPAGPALQ